MLSSLVSSRLNARIHLNDRKQFRNNNTDFVFELDINRQLDALKNIVTDKLFAWLEQIKQRIF